MSPQPPSDSAATASSSRGKQPRPPARQGARVTWSNRLLDTVISLASRASAGLPEVPRNSNEQLNAAAARPANPMISLPFRRSRQTPNIDALYGMIVAQARSPAFYRGYGVPDTVAGRLDMIVLHLVLLLRQLPSENGGGVADRPAAVRPVLPGHRRQLPRNGRRRPHGAEGDAAVAEAFYGRAKAYESALADDDRGGARSGRQRATCSASAEPPLGARRLAAYMREASRRLSAAGAAIAGARRSLIFPTRKRCRHEATNLSKAISHAGLERAGRGRGHPGDRPAPRSRGGRRRAGRHRQGRGPRRRCRGSRPASI